MLKVTKEIYNNTVVLIVEGSLSGPWVQEVDRVCRVSAVTDRCITVTVDLSQVTFVSEEGKELLERLCASGAEIISSDVLTKSLVEEIQKRRKNV
jgi:anti-anti-sigma regulatory factor